MTDEMPGSILPEAMDLAAALGADEVIVYPVPERPEIKCWLMRHHVLGHLAMWAVRLSPYDVPDNLEAVLRRLGERIRPRFDAADMAELTWREVDALIRPLLFADPRFMAWNERKNGRDGTQFVTSFSTIDPDDDFIDLDALLQNMSMSLFRELDRDDEFDRRFDANWRAVHGTDGNCENCTHGLL